MSWSRSEDVARGFALAPFGQRGTTGGSVLLHTVAPRDAVICFVAADDDSYLEQEVLIDRKRLGAVRVIRRYSQEIIN